MFFLLFLEVWQPQSLRDFKKKKILENAPQASALETLGREFQGGRQGDLSGEAFRGPGRRKVMIHSSKMQDPHPRSDLLQALLEHPLKLPPENSF